MVIKVTILNQIGVKCLHIKDLKKTLIHLKKDDKTFKFTYEDVGKALGTSGTNISQRVKRDSILNVDEIKKIESHFKVKLIDYKPNIMSYISNTANYLLSNDVEKHKTDIQKFKEKNGIVMPEQENNNIIHDEDYIMIPYYTDLVASCGAGGFALEYSPNQDFFPISTKYGLTHNSKYFIIRAFGNSMIKTIYDKEFVIFEEWENKQIIDDEIFFFCYEDRLYIKRLIYNIDEVVVLSDNTDRDEDGKLIYEKKSIKKDDINNLKIYGRFKGKIRND